jgi:outer membrane receptor protein involved in Fe transport
MLFVFNVVRAQTISNKGMIAGNVLDADNGKSLEGATVSLLVLAQPNASPVQTMVADKEGAFLFEHIAYGYYTVLVKMTGYAGQRVDSIFIREERADFNIGDLKLSKSSSDLDIVIVYAEKPLFENKDGKITFNAGESALSAGSTTTELLKQTPLVSVDADGKILMKGKEVKILIDDKPVEMDARQLQDLLESMPGSMIEKIEVLTTPPPQYANERGGVINIVTKKGKVGVNGRLNVNYGTRGEVGINGSFNYRKNKWAVNFSSGISYNRYRGNSYSNRENIYTDSTNYFNTIGNSFSENTRPNTRLTLDYDLNKQQAFNFTAFYNTNQNTGESATQYSNINQYKELYKLSMRTVGSESSNQNPSASMTYTQKWKTPGEILRITGGAAFSKSTSDRHFYQQYLFPDGSFNGLDSTQEQNTHVKNHTLSLRVNYDKPLKDLKTQLNFGGTANYSNTQNQLQSSYLKKPENIMVGYDLLSNDFGFYQSIYSLKAAIRYQFTSNFFTNVGLQQEYAHTSFDIARNTNHYPNRYFSTLPFANVTLKWDSGYTVTASYKRSIQRPGINQLNPSVDYSDPYNTRFGNPFLQPYFSDNFDLNTGYWNKKFNLNISVGYNVLQDIYSSIRTLQPDGKTFTTWQNLSGRKEYESSIWGGVTIGKKLKLNASSSYTYNVYSQHDQTVKRYQNGGSLHASFNGNYQWNSLLNFSGNFTYHRFATPQGSARNNLSMNLGVQQKFFKKNLSVSLNIVDPFRQQENSNYIQAANYNLTSFSASNSRNIRITAGYSFKKKVKKRK